MDMVSFMGKNHISPKDGDAKDASPRVSGMPTIAELRRRVMVRQGQIDKEKKGAGKKHRSDLDE